MAGKLYLCATPIGNLEDITFRVIRTLKEVDLIAAEDTRNSIKLLNHFEISTPMTSYHEYNKIDKGHYLIGLMQQGQQIALITDAGTPGISDPGEELVAMCHEAGIDVYKRQGDGAWNGCGVYNQCNVTVSEGFLPQYSVYYKRRAVETVRIGKNNLKTFKQYIRGADSDAYWFYVNRCDGG